MAAIALLAAFGLKALEGRFHGRSLAWRLVLAGVFAALTLEYAVGPAEYERVTARSIDDALHADPRDGAVLEVPANVADSDADAMFRSLAHGKRVVNGVSGFIPESLRELSGRLTMPATPFPSREAQAALARIYPLHHLVVRLGDPSMTEGWRPAWLALRQAAPPMLRFRGTFGTDDLYDVLPLPERGVRMERWVSYDFLRGHPVLRVELEPRLRTAGIDQWVNVSLNDRLLRHVPLTEATTLAIELPGPYRRAA